MSKEISISKINKELISAFAILDGWFDHSESSLQEHDKLSAQVNPSGMLRYVLYGNHCFLTLIERQEWQSVEHALKKTNDLQLHQEFTYTLGFEPELDRIKSIASVKEMRKELRDQLYRFLCFLDLLSVDDDNTDCLPGKSYQLKLIYLIAVHIRHQAMPLADAQFAAWH